MKQKKMYITFSSNSQTNEIRDLRLKCSENISRRGLKKKLRLKIA